MTNSYEKIGREDVILVTGIKAFFKKTISNFTRVLLCIVLILLFFGFYNIDFIKKMNAVERKLQFGVIAGEQYLDNSRGLLDFYNLNVEISKNISNQYMEIIDSCIALGNYGVDSYKKGLANKALLEAVAQEQTESIIRLYEAQVAAMELAKKQEATKYSSGWDGSVLTPSRGVVWGPTGKETYYNLDMSGVVSIMRDMGYSEEEYPYWVRDDGVKMLGDYVMVAANLSVYPRGSLVPCSLGTGIVCDTGGFAVNNPSQLDIATAW